MKTLVELILLLVLSNFVKAQNDTLEKSKYSCTVVLINGHNSIRGEIYSVNDSFIIIKHKQIGKQITDISLFLDTIPFYKIDKIRIGKNSFFMNKVIMYSLIGTTACVIGASGQDLEGPVLCPISPLHSDSSLMTDAPQSSDDNIDNISVFGEGIFGALIGVISNNNINVIHINGKIENFIQRRSDISSYSIIK